MRLPRWWAIGSGLLSVLVLSYAGSGRDRGVKTKPIDVRMPVPPVNFTLP